MTYQDALQQARDQIGPYCKACPVCNGRACRNQIPGPDAKALVAKLGAELSDTMQMCGAASLKEINRDMVRL